MDEENQALLPQEQHESKTSQQMDEENQALLPQEQYESKTSGAITEFSRPLFWQLLRLLFWPGALLPGVIILYVTLPRYLAYLRALQKSYDFHLECFRYEGANCPTFFEWQYSYLIVVLGYSVLPMAAFVHSQSYNYGRQEDWQLPWSQLSWSPFILMLLVWGRHVVTLLWAYLFMIAYQVAFAYLMTAYVKPWQIIVLLIWSVVVGLGLKAVSGVATVVSSYEEVYGLGSMKKSWGLLMASKLHSCGYKLRYAVATVVSVVPVVFELDLLKNGSWTTPLWTLVSILLFGWLWWTMVRDEQAMYFQNELGQ